MLIILTAALLPLGLIALFASLESAKDSRLRHEADARATAALSARQLTGTIGRVSLALRDATAAMTAATSPAECRHALDALRRAQRFDVQFAALGPDDRVRCTTAGFSAAPVHAPEMLFATEVRIAAERNVLRFEARGDPDGTYGIGELPVATLTEVTRPAMLMDRPGVTLAQGGERLVLTRAEGEHRQRTVSAPIAGGQAQLELTTADMPVTAIELLMALLPILMWLAAALIGWVVVNRLLIRPLLQLQAAVEAHDADGGGLVLPHITTPAREIRDLGRAFQRMTDQIKRHEAELEGGLARQTKLTREVHHRVKNNLQVVSSLINLHARGSASAEAASAYASIQRRVDALAVVHRNHYAEMEENRGVALRALFGELASNLRATAPPEASHLVITLDVAPVAANQDVAVPVAFLITELVELAIGCAPTDRVAVTLTVVEERPGRALLGVLCPGLANDVCRDHPSFARFTRVCDGLARQLRATLARDYQAGRFEIEIATVG